MKSPVLGLALSSVAFGASSIYLWVQLAAAQTQAEAMHEANAALAARIVELQRPHDPLATGQQSQTLNGAGPQRSIAGRPEPGSGEGPEPAVRQPVWSMTRRTVGSGPQMPEAMVKMMRANLRAQNKRMYFDLQSKLGLTAGQTSDLLDLLTEERTAGFKGPRNLDPEQARDAWEAEQAKRKAAIEELLGPAKTFAFEEYQKSMPARSELLMISQQLESVETPLDDSQRSRLLDALVAERERIPMPTLADGTSQEDAAKTYEDWQVDYDKRVAEAARGILTAEQFNTYGEYQQWQREMRQQFAAQRPGGGPPVRMLRGDSTFFAPAPGGAVSYAVATGSDSSSPTEKPANSQ